MSNWMVFTRRPILVAGGHKTETPASGLTYASIVSREMAFIASQEQNLIICR